MRKDNINWTEILSKDILRFGDLSHHQRKDKGITSLADYREVYLKCEDCDAVEKFKKVGHVWSLKSEKGPWKAFIRKAPVFKDVETSGYRFYTQIEFYCSSCASGERRI